MVQYTIKLSDTFTIGYQVRISARAKNVRLKLSARDGLTVVAPRTFNLARIPEILKAKKNWIASHLERFVEIEKHMIHNPPALLPEALSLTALGETWLVEYRSTKARSVAAITDKPGRIVVRGAIDDRNACWAAMRRWLARRTHDQIVPWLTRVSQESGMHFSHALVKGQKTRWASCSRIKTISLNYKLLFLPRHLVRYILLHELCHTLQMNHSYKFWTLLMSFEQDYKKMDEELKQAWKLVPRWVARDRTGAGI